MGEIYVLVARVKRKLHNCRRVPRRRDVSWRRTGALHDRFDWVANVLGLTFVDPNSWIEDGDFVEDRLQLKGRGKRRLGQIYAKVSGLGVGGSAECNK